MSDIAARAGTTIGVVSVALNGAKSTTLRVSPETRKRIQDLAAELGYRRDPRASALATGKNHVIGLMLPHAHSFAVPDPFYSLVSSGVAAAASQLGYNLMLYTAVAEEESDRAAKMVDRRVDGLILVLPPDDTPIVDECRHRGVAAIAILQRPDQAPLTVNSCDYEGGRLATEHLIELGHRKIAHLYGNRAIHTSETRHRAYVDALANVGIKADPELTVDGSFDRPIAHAATQKLLKLPPERRPTAIFAANDLSAHGAIEAIHEAGLRVPEDVSVVGYDDTWYALVTSPPLTSVNMAVDLIGRRAAEMLIASIDGRPDQQHAVLPVSLTVRRSSGPPPSEPR